MNAYMAALIDLHRGVGREGPGDEAFSWQLLAELPPLPAKPRLVDLGCGSGAGALLLAEHFGVPVVAVDLAPPFLVDMTTVRRGARAPLQPPANSRARCFRYRVIAKITDLLVFNPAGSVMPCEANPTAPAGW